MRNFKGFDDWVEIFRGGKQTDSNGISHDGDALIDNAIAKFNPEHHEPPIVVGHPQDNSPAFGWISELKTDVIDGAKSLLIKAKDIVPEFGQAVEKGLYKKRSASFYPDGGLRHVGFLGAAPPAVKGLADLKFDENDEALTFDFADSSPWIWNTVADIFRGIRDWLIEKEGKETADQIIRDWNIEDIRAQAATSEDKEPLIYREITNNKKEVTDMDFKEKLKGVLGAIGIDISKIPDDALPETPAAGAPLFSEADIATAKTDAAAAERKKADAEFAEKERQTREDDRKKEITDWVGVRVKDGKILPSWADSGLTAFMQNLDAETEIKFAEGAEKKSPLVFFQGLLESLEKSPIFKEIAVKEKAGDSGDFAEAKEDQKAGEAIAAKVNPAANK